MGGESQARSGKGTALTAQTLVTAWEQFLQDYYKSEIEEVALSYPEQKSVIVDWSHIDLRDPSLAQYLLEHPVAALKAAEDAVRSIEVPVEPRPKLHVRVRNLPKVHHFLVRKLRAEHLGRFVAIEGMVKKVVEVRPKLEDAIFRCEMCGAVFKIKQEDQLLREPDVCPEEQGGCGRKGVFKLLTEESKFIDHQKIEMQESHEDLRGGAQPERIAVYLEDDIVGNVAPGDRIVINGILRAQQRRQGSLKYAEFLKVLDCVSIEVQQHEFEEIEITPEDVAEIQRTSQTPNLYDHLRGAFAPEIYGLDEIKDCLLLALFGGEAKEYADGTRLRGDMHVLLVGDPGCHARGQPILMFDGTTKPVEDVHVGEALMGPDSTPRRVLAVGGGRGQMVRIVPTKGKPFVVNLDHILTLRRSKAESDLIDVSVREYLKWPVSKRERHKLVRAAVNFPALKAPLPIDPYFLGVLIGDGSTTQVPQVTTADEVVREEVFAQAETWGVRVHLRSNGSLATSYSLCRPKGRGMTGGHVGNPNPLTQTVRSLGLDLECGSKFIPQAYKTASRSDRLQLLAGLIDTDGSLTDGGYDFSSKSRRLAEDVAFVARSLGFAAYVQPSQKAAQTGAVGTYYRLFISGDCSQIPARVPTKRASPRRQVKSVLHTGFRVEMLAEDDYFGFVLDKDHRYLLDDFTITHNTGKSQLLRYISKLAPRAVYTSGKGSSASGLTAAAVRDEFGEGQWVLEAGALVLADRGVALVDELDKMDAHDQSAMHQAMEQQEISIAKAGITATLKSRCAVIGGANPKLGRFDEFTNILAQINMPPPLLSRFDLIFSLRDKPQRETDARLARHILTTHRAGEVMEYRRLDPEGPFSEDYAKGLLQHIHPTVAPKMLRKYIAYAKRFVHPVMTEEAIAQIEQYYVDLRSSSSTIPFTARALESIVRLCEASARARLSQTATADDAQHAIKLYTHALRGVGWNEETGSLDIDIIAAGASQSQQDRMRRILQVIRQNTNAAEDKYPDTQTIIREAVAQGIPEAKVKEALDILKERGSVYSPRHDRWAAV